MGAMRFLAICLTVLPVTAQQRPNQEAVFTQNCATCHSGTNERVPSREALSKMTPEAVFRALSSGAMRVQAAALNETAKRSLAEFVTGGALNLANAGAAATMPNRCPADAQQWRPGGASWSGW